MQRAARGGTAKEDLLAPGLEELLALTAHELHEPLRKIAAFGELLRQRAGPALDEESLDYLRRIERASERMRTTLALVIAFARVPRGLPFVNIDLGEAATGALEKVREAAAACDARIEIAELPSIQGDPFQMQQLFELLLDNAIKFRREDVQLVVRIDAPPRESESDEVAVRVTDNGQGFENAYAARIFQPFERLHPRGKYSGAGMGLTICQKIAERHGGHIEARGAPGEGAVFTLFLPRATEPQPRAREAHR
jgi:signal transduction histidine kinase